MSLSHSRCAVVMAVLLALPWTAAAQSPADAGLTRGIAQVKGGFLDDAVTTLNDAVRHLSTAPARNGDLAQAYLWLGIAYAQLDSEKSSRASFREALKLDPRMTLAEGWSAKVARLFAAARAEVAASGTAPAAAPAAATASAPAASAPATSSLTPEENAVYDKYQYYADGLQLEEAETVLRDWMNKNPRSARACGWLAEFYLRDFSERPARFDDGMILAGRCISLDDPNNPTSRQTLANMFWAKAYGDGSLTDQQKEQYANRGIKYADEALAINPKLIDSIVFKGLLLRIKAAATKDEKARRRYLDEASVLHDHAMELRRSGEGKFSGAQRPSVAGAASLPDLAGASMTVSGGVPEGVVGGVVGAPTPAPAAVRVGGQIKEPRKTKHVEFVYPEIAKSARVQGIVILECTISPEGKVIDVKVLRGIPLLDGAAVEAVKQWEYVPTLLNNIPVPVIMTVTANFKLS